MNRTSVELGSDCKFPVYLLNQSFSGVLGHLFLWEVVNLKKAESDL